MVLLLHPLFRRRGRPTGKGSAQSRTCPRTSVSPEFRTYIEEAQKYWTESGECLEPARAVPLLDKAIDAALPSFALNSSGSKTELSGVALDVDASDLWGKPEAATKAIRLSPVAKAYAIRGLICLKQNHPKGAQRDFEYAEKLNPKEPLIYIHRAAGAFLEGRKGDACDDLEHACPIGSCLPWENAILSCFLPPAQDDVHDAVVQADARLRFNAHAKVEFAAERPAVAFSHGVPKYFIERSITQNPNSSAV